MGFLVNVKHKFFSMYLFLFITLYMFRAHRAHHQERQIVSIQPLVTVILCWWLRCVQVETCTHLSHQLRMTITRGCIDTICPSWWWARCARNMYRVINRNKYIEKNLCITLVIYQESLHDVRSTECKKQNGKSQKFLCTMRMRYHMISSDSVNHYVTGLTINTTCYNFTNRGNVRGLSGKYLAIFNISRTGRVALM